MFGVANPPKVFLLLLLLLGPPKVFPPVDGMLPKSEEGCPGFVLEPNSDGCEAPELVANPVNGLEDEVVAGVLVPPNILLV